MRKLGKGISSTVCRTVFGLILASGAAQIAIAAPQAVVSGNSFVLEDGTSTQSSGGTIIPSVLVDGETAVRKFRIGNVGDETLTITLPITLTGPHAADFSIAVQPAGAIPPGFESEFAVVFDPSVASGRSATINISTNDPVIGLYNFPIDGNGDASAPSAVADLTGFFGQPFKTKCTNGDCEIKGTLFVGNAGDGTYTGANFSIFVMQGDVPLVPGDAFASANGQTKALPSRVPGAPVKYAKAKFTVAVPDGPYRIYARMGGNPDGAVETNTLNNLVSIVPPTP